MRSKNCRPLIGYHNHFIVTVSGLSSKACHFINFYWDFHRFSQILLPLLIILQRLKCLVTNIYHIKEHLVDINNIASTHMSFWTSFFDIVGMLSFHRSRLLFSSFFNAFLFSLLFPPFLLIPLPLPCCHISTSFLLLFLFLFFLQLPQVPSLWHLFSLQDRNPICRGLLWAPPNKYF